MDELLAATLVDLEPLAGTAVTLHGPVGFWDYDDGPPIPLAGKYLEVWNGDLSAYGDRSKALFAITSYLLRKHVAADVTVAAVASLDSQHYNKYTDREGMYWTMADKAADSGVAQRQEQQSPKLSVEGSSPSTVSQQGVSQRSDYRARNSEDGGSTPSLATNYYEAGAKTYYAEDGAYWVTAQTGKDKVETRELCNFVFEEPALVLLDGDQWLSSTVKVDRRYRSRADFLIPAANFKTKLPSLGGGMWLGSDNDLAHVLRWVQRDAPTFTGVGAVGMHTINDKRLFVADGEVYDARGPITDSGVRYVRRFGATTTVRFGDSGVDVGTVGALLTALNTPDVIWPVIGWAFAAPFADMIRAKAGHFPILSIFGSPGGGKTMLAQTVLRFIRGFEPDLLKPSTLFTLLTELSSTNSVPLVYDEVRSRDRGGAALLSLLKELYTGSVAKRGTQTQHVNEYALTAPTAIIAEIDQRGNDLALSDRILPVYLPPKERRLDSMSQAYYALRELSDTDASGFAYQYMLYTLRADFDGLWTEANQIEADDESDREMDNIRSAILGAIAFIKFTGIDPGLIDVAIDSIGALYSRSERSEAGAGGRVQPPLWTWIEQLSVLAHQGQVYPDVDYSISKGKIHIHRASMWRKYQKEYERDPERVEASSHTIGRWITENPGGVVASEGQVSVGGRTIRGFSISVPKAQEMGVDVTGFTKGREVG